MTFSAQIGAWDQETMGANAERIVACVNACAGIPTEDLVYMETGHPGYLRGRFYDSDFFNE